jgi:hypothetical protein
MNWEESGGNVVYFLVQKMKRRIVDLEVGENGHYIVVVHNFFAEPPSPPKG